MLDAAILERKCRDSGLDFRRHTDFHYSVRGRYEVNVYPSTGRLHLKGGNTSGRFSSVDQIIDLAHGEEALKVRENAKRRPLTSKKEQLWRHSHICGICKDPIESIHDATVDHIVPLARGGSNRFDNFQLAHENCNSEKGCNLK